MVLSTRSGHDHSANPPPNQRGRGRGRGRARGSYQQSAKSTAFTGEKVQPKDQLTLINMPMQVPRNAKSTETNREVPWKEKKGLTAWKNKQQKKRRSWRKLTQLTQAMLDFKEAANH
ncbi:uncharacterized protein PGTG_14701 [Puccinia graminis f. sp. tritici CRL 75-36-700-3]|uniref:Uncharacterized protein n=1 Tax=Puccinia graminis f. sp. tritici (strain CRL 75-36-700-3 / race SCCL) TaxID=418459 RepID=E3KWR8_PUCGT|nr:uncharacterized protein PGTG_14701 [Puccinia graminis f. sp. tritici CRL 75-36-700-3]EFP88735.2 hypothetical protein PGTG_14701 [Puccinia graminis f. sp. tritici CRL 75-36-700-3]